MAVKPYFEKDGIILFHGDCLEVLPQLEAETFDLVVTDPPYLVSYSGRWGSDIEPIHGDGDASWVGPAFEQIYRLLAADSLCLSFYGWPQADLFVSTWKRIGFRPVSLIVGIKYNWGLGHYTRSKQETAYLLAKGHPKKPTAAIADFFTWPRQSRPCHPNEKPLSAISALLQSLTTEGSRVLDPFSGSGTTLVAARNLGVSAVGIEISERYCEITSRRLSEAVFHRDRHFAQLTLF